jgi:hypothetical protein
MPTRKQRRRAQKERRHEYETVWVDAEGNVLDEPPEELVATTHEKRENGKSKAKAQPQRGGRAARVPPAPSWRRAGKRSLILGGAIFALFYILGSKPRHGTRARGALHRPLRPVHVLHRPLRVQPLAAAWRAARREGLA